MFSGKQKNLPPLLGEAGRGMERPEEVWGELRRGITLYCQQKFINTRAHRCSHVGGHVTPVAVDSFSPDLRPRPDNRADSPPGPDRRPPWTTNCSRGLPSEEPAAGRVGASNGPDDPCSSPSLRTTRRRCSLPGRRGTARPGCTPGRSAAVCRHYTARNGVHPPPLCTESSGRTRTRRGTTSPPGRRPLPRANASSDTPFRE